jgi:hypothetical protein
MTGTNGDVSKYCGGYWQGISDNTIEDKGGLKAEGSKQKPAGPSPKSKDHQRRKTKDERLKTKEQRRFDLLIA